MVRKSLAGTKLKQMFQKIIELPSLMINEPIWLVSCNEDKRNLAGHQHGSWFHTLKDPYPSLPKEDEEREEEEKVKVTRTRTAGLMVLKAKGLPSWLRHLLDQHSANNITL